MEQIICYLTPAILLTLLHIFKLFLLEEKYNILEILTYYLKASIIVNIFMILIVLIKCQDFVWNLNITNSFIIKYVLLGSFLSLFLPYLYYEVRTLKNKNKKDK